MRIHGVHSESSTSKRTYIDDDSSGHSSGVTQADSSEDLSGLSTTRADSVLVLSVTRFLLSDFEELSDSLLGVSQRLQPSRASGNTVGSFTPPLRCSPAVNGSRTKTHLSVHVESQLLALQHNRSDPGDTVNIPISCP
jgi:hypothetical protein